MTSKCYKIEKYKKLKPSCMHMRMTKIDTDTQHINRKKIIFTESANLYCCRVYK